MPARSATAVAAPLLRLATTERDDAALYALAALGGLPGARVGPQLLAAARSSLPEHPREWVRLLIETLHRASASTEPVASAIIATEEDLRACLQAAASYGDFSTWRDLLRDASDTWFLRIRRLRDRARMPPPSVDLYPPNTPRTAIMRGASRDRTVLTEVLSQRWPWSGCDSAFERGMAIGIYGVTMEERQHLLDALHANPTVTESTDCLPRYLLGFEAGERALHDDSPCCRPDPGTRLADADVQEVPSVELPTEQASDPRTAAHAAWDLQRRPILASGSVVRIASRHAYVALDEDEPPGGFGWLGTPGHSRFEFTFSLPSGIARDLQVVIEGQKGLRGAFPWGGFAGIEVLLDGLLLASWHDPGRTERQRFIVPLPPLEASPAREIVVRLASSSNTTFRLYRVAIE